MGLIQKAFGDIITFSRSSNATRVGPDGLIQYAPHNLLAYSEQFDDASWTKTATTVTANSASAPNGNVTADALVVSTETSAQGISSASFTADGSSSYTSSIYIKKGGNVQLQFNFRSGLAAGSTYSQLVFNTTTGFVSFSLSSATSGTYTVSESGEWWRIAVTAGGIPAGSMRTHVRLVSLPVNTTIYLWGAQLAVGPLALDYTPTTTAAVYGPRFDFDGSGVTSVDPVSRNLVLYSQEFENAYWLTGSGSVTVTANATTAPDGTVTADLVIPSAASAFHRLSSPDLGQTTVSYSVFVKAGGYSKVALRENATQGSYISVNLNTGTIIESANVGTGTVSGATITSFGNGWYRISGYFVTPVNSAWGLVVLPDSYTSGSVTTAWTGNGTSGVYVWGAQSELGSTATGYMVSGATNGFRAVPVVTGSATPRGLLIEEQRTNLLLYSEQFDNAAWVKSNSTISANVIVAPDGTVTADKLVENTSTLVHDCRQTVIKATSQINYAATFYAKAAERTFVRMFLYNEPSSNRIDATVNLSNGTVSYVTSNGTWTEGGCSVLAIGNGWYRITVTGLSNTGTSVRLLIATSNGPTSGDSVYTGDGTSGIYIWGAQLEAASFATSYIPTVASAVTRSADVATINTLSPFFNATEGTMFAQFDSAASGTNTIAAFDDNTANENYRLRNVGTDPKFTVTDGGVDQCDINGGTIAANTVYNFAAAYKANDFAVCIAGGTVQTDTSGTLPTVDRLRIGTSQAGNYLNGHVRRFAYYPRLLANAELQALTA